MSGRVDVLTILGLIEASGFQHARSAGSHHQYTNGQKTVTVPWSNKGDFLPVGTAKSIARAAGPHVEEALKDILGGGGGKALKQHIKAFRQGLGL